MIEPGEGRVFSQGEGVGLERYGSGGLYVPTYPGAVGSGRPRPSGATGYVVKGVKGIREEVERDIGDRYLLLDRVRYALRVHDACDVSLLAAVQDAFEFRWRSTIALACTTLEPM